MTQNNNNLYRLVYCSRNRISGSPAEMNSALDQILAKARLNNARANVTGALLFNEGSFAQVLEGPLTSVEEIFEKIQCDPRHTEVTVIDSGYVPSRHFSDWDMAFAGPRNERQTAETAAAVNSAFAHTGGAGQLLVDLLGELVLQEHGSILLDR